MWSRRPSGHGRNAWLHARYQWLSGRLPYRSIQVDAQSGEEEKEAVSEGLFGPNRWNSNIKFDRVTKDVENSRGQHTSKTKKKEKSWKIIDNGKQCDSSVVRTQYGGCHEC